MANEVIAKPKSQVTFSGFMTSEGIKKKVNEIIGSKEKGARFISSIVSAVSTNPQLGQCENALIFEWNKIISS